MISRTPIVRPRETSGAHRIERVSNCVRVSTLRVKRGSRATSLTIAGLPVWATQPATPSPILSRNERDVAALGAERRLEDQLLLLLVDHQQRPGLGGDQLRIFSIDQLDHLARLEDRVGGLDDVGQDRQALGGGLAAVGPPRRCAPPHGAAREVGQHGGRGRVGGLPGLEHEVELRAAARRRSARGVGGRASRPPTGRPGSARRTALSRMRGAGRRRPRAARRGSARGRAAGAVGAGRAPGTRTPAHRPGARAGGASATARRKRPRASLCGDLSSRPSRGGAARRRRLSCRSSAAARSTRQRRRTSGTR